MKRSREVSIIVNALVAAGFLEEGKTDRARNVINEAIKTIRTEHYEEKMRRRQGGCGR